MNKSKRIEPGPGQESVWDYPRPPRLEESSKHIQVIFNGVVIADTRRALNLASGIGELKPIGALSGGIAREGFARPESLRRLLDESQHTRQRFEGCPISTKVRVFPAGTHLLVRAAGETLQQYAPIFADADGQRGATVLVGRAKARPFPVAGWLDLFEPGKNCFNRWFRYNAHTNPF